MERRQPRTPEQQEAIRLRFSCVDCRLDTSAASEYFILKDVLWREHAYDVEKKMLCVGCFESRLGRQLVPGDFTRCYVNDVIGIRRSARLRARLGLS